jgi:hypothetical protein
MSAENLSPGFAEFDQSTAVDLAKVLALQSLVLGPVREIARNKGRRVHSLLSPGTHAFCLMQNTAPPADETESVYTGERDRFVSCRVGRLEAGVWAMGIVLQENEMKQGPDAQIDRTIYRFRWNGSMAVARKEFMIPVYEAGSDIDLVEGRLLVLESLGQDGIKVKSPLEEEEFMSLSEQMVEIAQAAKSRAA